MSRSIIQALLFTITSLLALCDGRVFDITTYGAVGDGKVDDTLAIRRAFAAASATHPTSLACTVLVPCGQIFLSGPFNITRSNFVLRIDGTLRAINGENMPGEETTFVVTGRRSYLCHRTNIPKITLASHFCSTKHSSMAVM